MQKALNLVQIIWMPSRTCLLARFACGGADLAFAGREEHRSGSKKETGVAEGRFHGV